MATTNFVRGTIIAKEWLNDVDALTYDVFGAPTTKAAAAGTLINGLTEDTTPTSSDFIMTYDTSATTGKKASPTAIVNAGVSTFAATLLDDATAAAARATLAAAGLADANTFTANQTIVSTDDGSGVAPSLILDRNSATPAANDSLGSIIFRGRDSGAGTDAYAQIYTQAEGVTAGAEEGRIYFQTVQNGTLTTSGYIRRGQVLGAPTGDDKGAGTMNAVQLWENNKRAYSGNSRLTSSGLSFATNGEYTFAHSLGATPALWYAVLRCGTAELGYAQNDELMVASAVIGSTGNFGVTVWANATVLGAKFDDQIAIVSRATSAHTNIDPAKWALVFYYWG